MGCPYARALCGRGAGGFSSAGTKAIPAQRISRATDLRDFWEIEPRGRRRREGIGAHGVGFPRETKADPASPNWVPRRELPLPVCVEIQLTPE